jgi:predicted transcriptional regulator
MIESSPELMTKHGQILRYIESLSIGARLSVRKIAQELEVSEGTAYRAIKEAENLGIVSTKGRAGTVRVEKKENLPIDKLTFAEVVKIVDGEVLGGSAGLHKTLSKFVIGAMELEDMLRYIEPGDLLLVGNRNKAHLRALAQGAAVLITGGFGTGDEVKQMADDLELPIISSTYDTYTVATLINRAIDDHLIKKKIILVRDIIRTDTPVVFLRGTDKVGDMQQIIEETKHTRFPVLDDHDKPIGMITTKDLIGAQQDQTIDKLMSGHPLTINAQASVSTAGHMMIWEGIELLPVVDGSRKMLGVISRKDVMKAMQSIQKQPHNGETFEDQIWTGFEELRNDAGSLYFRGSISAQMTNYAGMVSEGVLTTLMNRAANRAVKENKKGDLILDSSSNFFLHPVHIDRTIEIIPSVIELSRRFCKIEIEIRSEDMLIAKSMVTARIINQS